MRKLQKAAVVAAMVGSMGFLGAGTAMAGGHGGPDVEVKGKASSHCDSHDNNFQLIGQVQVLSYLIPNLISQNADANSENSQGGTTNNCPATGVLGK